MITEIEGLRPAVISKTTGEMVEKFLRFRHLVRNVYSFNLFPEKIQTLVDKLSNTYENVKKDLSDFVQLFLKEKS